MADYNFVINVDLERLLDGIYKFPNIEIAVKKGIENGIEELKDRIVEKLIENISKYGLSNSLLASTINVEKLENGISINMGSDYAVFVEYGTGIIGSQNQHPNPARDGWIYDVNKHGENGWWYPSNSQDPNKNKYITEDGTILAWTQGMRSRPFMYDTWLWASRSANQIIVKRINRELEKEIRRNGG